MKSNLKYYILCIVILASNISYAGKKYVIAAGPCCGKSTMIELLRSQGYQTVSEVFSILYLQAKAKNGLAEFFKEKAALLELVVCKQIEAEDMCDQTRDMFLDRSVFDNIFYASHWNVAVSQEIREITEKRSYDIIFFLDPLPAHFFENNEVRKDTKEEATQIHTHFQECYLKSKLKVIRVPFDTPENRVQFILNAIKNEAAL